MGKPLSTEESTTVDVDGQSVTIHRDICVMRGVHRVFVKCETDRSISTEVRTFVPGNPTDVEVIETLQQRGWEYSPAVLVLVYTGDGPRHVIFDTCPPKPHGFWHVGPEPEPERPYVPYVEPGTTQKPEVPVYVFDYQEDS